MRPLCALIALTGLSLNASPNAACGKAIGLFRQGDLPGAQDLLWDCVQSASGDDTHAFYLAQTYRGLRNHDLGIAKAMAALKESPNRVDLLYLAGYLHYRRNDTRQAMVLATRANKLAPDDWRVHQLFALNYISFNMYELAKLSLSQAIRLNPENAELHYQLARLYFSLGSFVQSIEASKRALEIFPDYPEAHHNLALAYEGSGDVPRALASFQSAVELNRKYKRQDEWPLIDYAVYERMGGNSEAAFPLLGEALRINPRSAKANYQMGELLRDTKRYAESKKYLETAVGLDPCDTRAIYGLAMVTRTLGNTAESLALLRRFKELNAENKDSRKGCRAAE